MFKITNQKRYRQMKWLMIALVIGLSIIFVTSLTMMVISYHQYNTYTTITM